MESKKQITSVSKVAFIFVKIAIVLAWVAIGFFTAAVIWFALAPESDGLLFKFGNTTIYGPVGPVDAELDVTETICTMVPAIIAMVFTVMIFYCIKPVLEDMKEGKTPFTKQNVLNIKKVSLYMLLMWLIPQGVQAALLALTDTTMPDTDFTFDKVIFALVVYCIALAFDYGTQLQKNEDETL